MEEYVRINNDMFYRNTQWIQLYITRKKYVQKDRWETVWGHR